MTDMPICSKCGYQLAYCVCAQYAAQSAQEVEIAQLRAEVARLKAGGCARDQRTTQFCAEAVALRGEVDRLKGLLREALSHVKALAYNYGCLDEPKAYAWLLDREKDVAALLAEGKEGGKP